MCVCIYIYIDFLLPCLITGLREGTIFSCNFHGLPSSWQHLDNTFLWSWELASVELASNYPNKWGGFHEDFHFMDEDTKGSNLDHGEEGKSCLKQQLVVILPDTTLVASKMNNQDKQSGVCHVTEPLYYIDIVLICVCICTNPKKLPDGLYSIYIYICSHFGSRVFAHPTRSFCWAMQNWKYCYQLAAGCSFATAACGSAGSKNKKKVLAGKAPRLLTSYSP